MEAAKRIYHKDNNALYFQKQRFSSVKQANKLLEDGQSRVQQLIRETRLMKLNHYGEMLGRALDMDTKIADMPQVRVVIKN